MGFGSVAGTVAGGLLLGSCRAVLIPLLGMLLLISSVNVWRHATPEAT